MSPFTIWIIYKQKSFAFAAQYTTELAFLDFLTISGAIFIKISVIKVNSLTWLRSKTVLILI